MPARKVVFLLQTDPFRPKPVLRALREARSLRKAGWEVSFVSWIKDPELPLADSDEYPVQRVRMPVPPLGTSMIGRASTYLRVSRRLRQAALVESPDLVIAHDFEVLSAAVSAGRRARIPVVYDSHEDWPALIAENSALEARIARMQERRLCPSVAHVVTVSEPIAAKFREMGIPVTVLYNARPSSEIVPADREASRTSFGFHPEDFVVGFAGALAAGRGLEMLIDSLPSVPASVKALIVGGPDGEAHRLDAYAVARALHERVRVDGYRSFRELARYYASMDLGVILLDRRPNHERALPNKLFDYMAHGVPVLVPDYPAMASVVRESRAGTTLRHVDAMAIREAIIESLDRRSELRGMGERGRQAFLDKFSWEKQEHVFLGVVKGICKAVW